MLIIFSRKPETPRLLRNPSNYLTTTKIAGLIKTMHTYNLRSFKALAKYKVEHNFERTEGPSSVPITEILAPQYFVKHLSGTDANHSTANLM